MYVKYVNMNYIEITYNSWIRYRIKHLTMLIETAHNKDNAKKIYFWKISNSLKTYISWISMINFFRVNYALIIWRSQIFKVSEIWEKCLYYNLWVPINFKNNFIAKIQIRLKYCYVCIYHRIIIINLQYILRIYNLRL